MLFEREFLSMFILETFLDIDYFFEGFFFYFDDEKINLDFITFFWPKDGELLEYEVGNC